LNVDKENEDIGKLLSASKLTTNDQSMRKMASITLLLCSDDWSIRFSSVLKSDYYHYHHCRTLTTPWKIAKLWRFSSRRLLTPSEISTKDHHLEQFSSYIVANLYKLYFDMAEAMEHYKHIT